MRSYVRFFWVNATKDRVWITCTFLGINADRYQIERKDPLIKNLKGQSAKHDRLFSDRQSNCSRSYVWLDRCIEILDIRSVTEEMYFLKLIQNKRSDEALVSFNSIFLNGVILYYLAQRYITYILWYSKQNIIFVQFETCHWLWRWN